MDSQNNIEEKTFANNSMKSDSNSFPIIYIFYIVMAIIIFIGLLLVIIKYWGKFQKSSKNSIVIFYISDKSIRPYIYLIFYLILENHFRCAGVIKNFNVRGYI